MINCTFEDGNKASPGLRHVVADAIVLKDNKILLTKREKTLLEGGKWSIVGGYIDRDELIEQAITREIREESGYTVSDLKLFCIVDNPKRRDGGRQNISFIYICEGRDEVGKPDWEVEEQKWFELENLPLEEEFAFDHLEIIQKYIEYQKERFDLPIFISK